MATILAEVRDAVQDRRTVVQEKPSIDEWVLGTLQQLAPKHWIKWVSSCRK